MRTLSKIVLLLSLFSVALFANLPKIDECKSDLYYANGIMMKYSKYYAETIWEEKATDLLLSNQEALNNIGKFAVSYNTSYGTASDLFEAFLQKVEGEAGLKVTWEAFKFFIKQKLKHADDLLSLAANASNSIENYDLTTQVNAYKNSIKSGHGVIVISHSQGNLFTNRAYAKLDEWMKPYFYNMGVATPADEVASNGPYVTFDNDPIHHIPGALDDNLYNQNRYYSHTNALGEKVEALTGAFHSFDYYLGLPVLVNDVSISSNQAAEKIKSFILEKIQAHANAPSQWETDQEFEKNTENYRISVKHRFDSSIITMDGEEEVFPFAPSKKLYYIEDGNTTGYVKASCGGIKIEDSWIGKALNELKRLVHTDNTLPHEIIVKKNLVVLSFATESIVGWNDIYRRPYFFMDKYTVRVPIDNPDLNLRYSKIPYEYISSSRVRSGNYRDFEHWSFRSVTFSSMKELINKIVSMHPEVDFNKPVGVLYAGGGWISTQSGIDLLNSDIFYNEVRDAILHYKGVYLPRKNPI